VLQYSPACSCSDASMLLISDQRTALVSKVALLSSIMFRGAVLLPVSALL